MYIIQHTPPPNTMDRAEFIRTYFAKEALTPQQLANISLPHDGVLTGGEIKVTHSMYDNTLGFSLPSNNERVYPMGAVGKTTPDICNAMRAEYIVHSLQKYEVTFSTLKTYFFISPFFQL